MQRTTRIQQLAADANRVVDRTLQSYPPNSSVYTGGDPSCWYHETRNFLLRKGIETRVFTFGSIPLPSAIDSPNIADRIGTLDNSFFFELRKTTTVEVDVKVNALVLLGRIFFNKDQRAREFHVQIVPNHFGDCIGQLNEVYNDMIDFFRNQTSEWQEPNPTANRVLFFERTFTNLFDFQGFMARFLEYVAKKHGLTGNNLLEGSS